MTVLCKRKLKSDLRLNMVIHCEIFVAVIFIFGTQELLNLDDSETGDVCCHHDTFTVLCKIHCDFTDAKIKLPNGNYYGDCLNDINGQSQCNGPAMVRDGKYEANLTMDYKEHKGEDFKFLLSCQNGTNHEFALKSCRSGFNITYCQNSDSGNINITFKDIDQPRQLDFKKENYSEILVSCDLDQAKCTNDSLASVHKGVVHIQMPLSYGRRFEISEDGQPKVINTEDAVSCHGKECNWRFLDDKTPPSHAVSPSPCHMALGLFLLALLINQRCFCFSFILLVCFLWAFLF